ncbi:hypothetical protein ILYODFUR_004215 [Ilyodon furcidens]|uniref:Uncharacterized protein n=1 Tax=Ilyodon furcidens TaxID=33524 RepID=A0ABV0SWQ7_9TELE
MPYSPSVNQFHPFKPFIMQQPDFSLNQVDKLFYTLYTRVPVDFISCFKALLCPYGVVNGQPPKLCQHLTQHTAACGLQFQVQKLLVVLYTKLKLKWTGAFLSVVPELWDSFPVFFILFMLLKKLWKTFCFFLRILFFSLYCL